MKSRREGPKLGRVEDILDLAITAEMDAHKFYLRAAEQVKDSNARVAFLALAGDEEGHRLQLEEQYHHLYEKRMFQYRPGTNILHRHLKRDLDDLEAIALGIKAEKDAISFYQESERAVKGTKLKKVLRALVEFEEGHRKLLESEYQARLGRPWNDFELSLWVRE